MFLMHILAGNVGFTNITEPELLPAFEKIVHLRVAELMLESPPQHCLQTKKRGI